MPSIPASHHDLLQAPYATLATIDPAGRPQLTQVVFLAEGDTVRISLNDSRRKTRNLLANGAASVLILDPAEPMRYLELRGDIEVAADPDLAFAHRAGAKYGMDFTQYDAPGDARVVATMRPVRVHAVDMRPPA